MIKVEPVLPRDELIDVFSELGSYDWIVFTSPNGVTGFFDTFFRAYDEIRNLGLLRFACVGEATRAAIEAYKIKVECMPKIATADALADALIATESLDSAKIVVVTGNLNRDTLIKRLEDEGRAIVDRLQLYQTIKTDLSGHPAATDFRERGADAVLFASSSAVTAFRDQAVALQIEEGARRPAIGSIGPQTTQTLTETGLKPHFEAQEPGIDNLITALVKHLGKTDASV